VFPRAESDLLMAPASWVFEDADKEAALFDPPERSDPVDVGDCGRGSIRGCVGVFG
jgi:hypothetical protein